MSVAGILWLGLTVGAPTPEAESALIKLAQAAAQAGAEDQLRKILRGWATLRRQRSLPPGMEAAAAEASAWAETAGLLRVYGSRLPGLVRIGVDDPAEIVGRLDVWVIDKDGRRSRLVRSETGAPGRNEYRIPKGGADRQVVVEAVMTELSPEDIVVWRTVLPGNSAPVPGSPDPKQAASRLGFKEPSPGPAVRPPEPAVRWWWVAVSVVAAGFVGAAIWQETRGPDSPTSR